MVIPVYRLLIQMLYYMDPRDSPGFQSVVRACVRSSAL